MTLLSIQLESLDPEPCMPIISRTLETEESRLYVIIFLHSELRSKLNSPAKRAGHYASLQKLVSALYICAASKMEVSCDVIFADWCGYDPVEEIWDYSVLRTPECPPPYPLSAVTSPDIAGRLPRSTRSVRMVTYVNDPRSVKQIAYTSLTGRDHPVVAVGGTFDHLHPGHKILLSLAAYICSRKLICGITDDELLKNKKYADLLESISLRTENVRNFLNLIARNLELDLGPIRDVYGPTAYDPDISALVISEETRAGAVSIADLRREKGLQELEVFVIEVIGEQAGKVGMERMAEEKMSSTKIRERLSHKTPQ